MQDWFETVRQWLIDWPGEVSDYPVGEFTYRKRFRYKKRKPWVQQYKGFNAQNIADPKAQMEFVARVDFEPKQLLNKSEHKILLLLESIVRETNTGLRVMAQTSMGEIIKPKKGSASDYDCNLAYRSINSKRLDFVVIDRFGTPVLAVEYQGYGHYRSRSFMRDAVKREVLRKANVCFIEVPKNYEALDLTERLRTLLRAHTKNSS